MSERLKSGYQEPHILDTTNLSELPEGWCWVHLSSIADVQLGQQRAPDHAAAENPIPYVRAANITWAGIDVADVKSMGFPNPERYSLEYGDVLLSEASGSPLEAGKPAIWRDEIPGACYQKTVIRIRPYNKALALPEFLHAVFLHDCVTGKFARLAPGVGIVHLTAERMIKWPVPLAPIVEQRRLVQTIESYFTRLDDTVATLERVERNLKRYRASVLKAAVEGRLVPTEAVLAKQEGRSYEPASVLLERILTKRRRRWSESGTKGKYEEPTPPDTTNLPDLPEGWCWANLSQLKRFSLYGPRFSSDAYTSEGQLVLRTSDISDAGKVNLKTAPRISLPDGEFRKYRVEVGDLLITRTGSLGTLAVFDDRVDAIPGAYLIQYRLEGSPILNWHCFHVFKSPAGQAFLQRKGQGVGRPNLNAPTIESYPVALPPAAEQVRINAELQRLTSVEEASTRQIAEFLTRCKRLRQSILKWAFEGRLADQDANDEPASVLLERIKAERGRTKAMTEAAPPRAAKKKQVRA